MRKNRSQHHRIRGTTPAVVAAARRLRLNLTTAEQKLWKALKKRQLSGLRFRCQHAIGSFIVDFYCPQCRLVIELDGDIHDQQMEYDAARTEQLNQLGYQVIRFRNTDVIHHLDSVLQKIRYASEQSIDLQSKSPKMGDLGGKCSKNEAVDEEISVSTSSSCEESCSP